MNILQKGMFCFCLLSVVASSADARLFRRSKAHDDTVINLARPDRDQPGDNSFTLSGAQYTITALSKGLTTRLPEILSQMKPTTDDPTIRNVSMSVNGTAVAFDFQKHVTVFWKSVEIGGTTSVESGNCPNADQTGFQIILNTAGSSSSEAQGYEGYEGYVDAARILICASEAEDSNGPALTIEMERDLYVGPQYEDWIGSLMGDFLRPFGQTLMAGLQ
jgi:hypothetical protein